LRELSGDEKARDLYERREKARRDHDMFVRGAKQEGIIEGRREGYAEVARNLIAMNMPMWQIEKATGLTHKEIERLQLH